MNRLSQIKFLISLVSLSVFTLTIPQISTFSIFIIPFVFRSFHFLSWPKYVFRYWPVSLSLLLLFTFSVINYYFVIYVYKLAHLDRPDFRFLIVVLTINVLYWLGICLDFRRMPFPQLSVLIVNLSIFAGGIVFSYMSVARYTKIFSPFVLSVLEERRIPNFWYPRGELINGPFFDMYSYLGLSIIGILIFCIFLLTDYYKLLGRAPKIFRLWNFLPLVLFIILLVLLVLIAFYSSVALGARTPVIVFVLSILVSISAINVSAFGSKEKIRLLMTLYTFLALFFLFESNLVFEMLQAIIYSFTDIGIGSRFGVRGMDTPRYELWQAAITQMWDFPFGGRQIPLPCCEDYVHNIWLDQLYDAGIVPMALLLLFHLSQIPVIIKLLSLKISILIKVFVLCTLIAFMAAFMGSPVLQSSYVYFSVTCFFFGSLARFVVDSERFNLSKSDQILRV